MIDWAHGWLILDKPLGQSSADLTYKVKRFFTSLDTRSSFRKSFKIGHGGTLDPLASGILPIAIGEATKTVSFVMDTDKDYEFEVTWGEERTTDDAEGEPLEISAHRPSRLEIEEVLPQFIGTILQTPPAFSALKVNGQRAYNMARRGEVVTLAPREIAIKKLIILDNTLNTARFLVTCGKGTYIRSLGRDLARMLGTRGYISALRRTRVGRFDLACSILVDNLERLGHNIKEQMIPLDAALDDIPAVIMEDRAIKALKMGQFVALSPHDISLLGNSDQSIWKIKSLVGPVVGLGRLLRDPWRWHLERGFNHG